MRRIMFGILISTIAAFPVLCLAQTLIPLTQANVIGGSGSWNVNAWNTGSFPATGVLDTQTGSVTDSGSAYWLGTEATANEYFVIDLGTAYSISQIDLFNTHNAGSLDRSTDAFNIRASNSVSGFTLVAPTLILSGNLPATSDPIAAATYTAGNGLSTGTDYRYLQFTAVSYPGGQSSSGLNEIRIYAIPEPGAWAAIAGALALAGACVRRWRALA